MSNCAKNFNSAMTNENAVFPQLSNKVAEDVTEVIFVEAAMSLSNHSLLVSDFL